MSSRPLNRDDYLQDPEILGEEYLPNLIEFDTFYYYQFASSDDDSWPKGEIKTIDVDIEKIVIESDGSVHKFILDAGTKKFEFMAETRFLAE